MGLGGVCGARSLTGESGKVSSIMMGRPNGLRFEAGADAQPPKSTTPSLYAAIEPSERDGGAFPPPSAETSCQLLLYHSHVSATDGPEPENINVPFLICAKHATVRATGVDAGVSLTHCPAITGSSSAPRANFIQ